MGGSAAPAPWFEPPAVNEKVFFLCIKCAKFPSPVDPSVSELPLLDLATNHWFRWQAERETEGDRQTDRQINTNTAEFLKRQFAVAVFVASLDRLVDNLLQFAVLQVGADHQLECLEQLSV